MCKGYYVDNQLKVSGLITKWRLLDENIIFFRSFVSVILCPSFLNNSFIISLTIHLSIFVIDWVLAFVPFFSAIKYFCWACVGDSLQTAHQQHLTHFYRCCIGKDTRTIVFYQKRSSFCPHMKAAYLASSTESEFSRFFPFYLCIVKVVYTQVQLCLSSTVEPAVCDLRNPICLPCFVLFYRTEGEKEQISNPSEVKWGIPEIQPIALLLPYQLDEELVLYRVNKLLETNSETSHFIHLIYFLFRFIHWV